MRSDATDEEPVHVSLAQDEGTKRELRVGRRAGPGQRAVTPGDLAWTIRLMDEISQTEKSIADTLRVMAASGDSQAAARRLRLAEAAIKGARDAAERSELLRRQADRLARHADVAALLHSLDHADSVLTDLAYTEKDIADILTRLTSHDGSDRTTRLRHLAQEALADAQRVNDRARILYEMAGSEARRHAR